MIILTVEEIIEAHNRLIQKAGGLNLNDIKLSYSQKELINLGLGTANGSLGYDKILAWIKEHEDYI